MKKPLFLLHVLYGLLSIPAAQAQPSNKWPRSFVFDEATKSAGVFVARRELYSEAAGYGFKPNDLSQKGSSAFSFSIALSEGNYNVRVETGGKAVSSQTSMRVECRRLMAAQVHTRKNEIKQTLFSVHLRDSINHKTGQAIKLKDRERAYLHWDHKLTLHFNGSAPRVRKIEIQPVPDMPILFLAGNSTVVDQAHIPYAAWGQILPSFFEGGKMAVANYAESGETLLAFQREGRLEKILSLMKKGDYLFIEFAHNDQKPGGNFLDPFTTYQESLKHYISAVKLKGGIPVLVTSMHRRNFDEAGRVVNTLSDYPEAMRQVAAETATSLIDLNAMSKVLYEAWGPEESKKAFVHFEANTFPGQDKALKDDTHFTEYGAYQLAQCVVLGIQKSRLPLAQWLRKDLPAFDPGNPPKFETFQLPLNVHATGRKPDGN